MFIPLSWIRNRRQLQRNAKSSPRKAHRRYLLLESLEGRDLLATLNLNFGTGEFTYTAGTSVANNLTIAYNSGTATYTFTDTEAITVTGDTGSYTVVPGGFGNVSVTAANETQISLLIIDLGDTNDSFTTASIGDPISINGGTETNTLTGSDNTQTWSITGANSGSFTGAGSTVSFSNFAALQGGTGSDTFNVTNASSMNLSGGMGNDVFDIDAALTGSVNGEGGSDTLQGNLIDAAVLTNSDVNGFDGTEASVSGNFSDVETITGNGGTLTGQGAASTWGLDGSPTYTTGGFTLNFSGFATLQGGSGVDTFNVTAASSFSLAGGSDNDIFDIDAALTGSVNGGANADTLQGDLIDAVTLNSSDANGFDGSEMSVSGDFTDVETITGSGGTLTGQGAASTWDLDGSPTYTTGGFTLTFTGFATLQGGSGVDTFNVSSASSFNLAGGTGGDTFDIDATLTGNVNGEGGSDTLQGNLIDAVALTNSDVNGFDGTEASVSGNFSDVETITGNGGTLTGQDAASTWGLDGSPTYTTGGFTLNFSGFATLQGGAGADAFNVSSVSSFNLAGGTGGDTFDIDATLTGSVNGEGGSDTLQGNVIDAAILTNSDANGFDGTETSVTGNFADVETITGNSGTLTGQGAASTWDLDGSPTYTTGGFTLNFTGFATLQGGSGVDTFNVTAASSFSLAGGADNDIFDIDAALTGSVIGGANSDTLQGNLIDAVTLNSSDANGFDGTEASVTAGFTDVETITGNSGTLTGQAGATATWGLDGSPTYTVGANSLNFTGFATLQGGSGADTFNVTATSTFNLVGGGGNDVFDIDAALTGSVNGEGGGDTLQGDTITNVSLSSSGSGNGYSGSETDVSGGFSNIDTLTGTGAGGTQLTGLDSTGTWALGASKTYTVSTRVLTFGGFATIQGGSAVDTFNVTAATSANLFGGGAGDIYNLSATLTGDISAEAGLDDINFLASGAVTGNVDGGSSAQLDFSAQAGPITIVLTAVGSIDGFQGTATGISGTFDNITDLIGSTGSDSLTGIDSSSNWGLDGSPSYVSTQTLTFTAIETLQGGTAADDFTVSANTTAVLRGGAGGDTFAINGATLTGTIDGEGGSDTLQGTSIDNVALTGSGANGFTGTEANVSGGFAGIDVINGNGGTITGQNVASTWDLDGSPTYTNGTHTLSLTGFTNLQGGSNVDTFNVLANSTFNLSGGAGADVFDVPATLTGSIAGQGDADTLQGTSINAVVLQSSNSDGFSGAEPDITAGFSGINTITGNGGTLSGRNVISTWDLDGTPTYSDGSQTLNFSGFANLQGGSAVDTFNITANSTFNLLGGGSGDNFVYGNGVSLTGTIDGQAGVDLLDYSAYTTTVSVSLLTGSATGASSLVATAANDSSIENVYGGSAGDTLTGDIDANLILGQGGTDTINAKAGVDNVDGGAGNDVIEVEGNEAEFDTIQGGPGGVEDPNDYDILRNIGGGPVTLNAFNSVYNVFANSIDRYEGNGQALQGNGSGNELHLGFTEVQNTPNISSGNGDDDVSTSHDNVVLGEATPGYVTYDGGAGTDNIMIVMTPDQFGALTTAEIFTLQDYVMSPTSKTLVVTQSDTTGNFRAVNFETARIAVYDDDIIIDITTCFLAVVSEEQIVVGTMGADSLIGTNLTDLIFGQDGHDTIYGGNALDCIFGGADNDTLYGENNDDLLVGGSGDDLMYGGDDEDQMYGNSGNDVMFGEYGGDYLNGGAGADMLDGGGDNDTLNGGPDVDSVYGADGPDIIQIEGTQAVNDTMDGGPSSPDTLDGIEILPGTGNATLVGFSNNGTFGMPATVDENVTSIEFIQGNNQGLQGTALNNLFNLAGVQPMNLAFVDGGAGDDILNGSDFPDDLRGGADNDVVNGNGGFDTLSGGFGADTLSGGLNDDVLDGGPGIDTVLGGDGYDTFKVRTNEAEFDVMNGGANTDNVLNDAAAPVVLNGFDASTNSLETWTGNNQPIVGNSNANILNFMIVNPTYSMTLVGVTFISGMDNNDTITGTNGADSIYGGNGLDTLFGMYGSDSLFGEAGDDVLNGGDGVDYLYGGTGDDRIITGAGRDIVYYPSNDPAEGNDQIDDFTTSDRIRFVGTGWTFASIAQVGAGSDLNINLPNGRTIKIKNRTSPLPSYIFLFV